MYFYGKLSCSGRQTCDDGEYNLPGYVYLFETSQTRYVSYHHSTNRYVVCQEHIGGYDNDDFKCTSCTDNGEGKCDAGHCPTNIWMFDDTYKNTFYHNDTQKCVLCQENIGGHKGLNCKSCTHNGYGKCDANQCSIGTFYQNSTRLCDLCQMDIGGHADLNCLSCTVNGLSKCDADGCPEPDLITHYNEDDSTCTMIVPVLCKQITFILFSKMHIFD